MRPTLQEAADIEAVMRELKALRESKGISQREIAEVMGLTQGNYSRLERGEYVPKMSTLQVWARALGQKVVFHVQPDTGETDRLLQEAFDAMGVE